MGDPQTNSLITDRTNWSVETLQKLSLNHEKKGLLALVLYDKHCALAHYCRKLSNEGINMQNIAIIGKSQKHSKLTLPVKCENRAKNILTDELLFPSMVTFEAYNATA